MALHVWPIADAPPGRAGKCVLARADAARARAAAVAALVRTHAAPSLTDADRARVPAIVEALVVEIERDLRLLILPGLDEAREPELAVSLGSAAVPIAMPRVLTALPLHPGLLAAALARAEMHRLGAGAEAPVPALAGPAPGERMALLLAERRRRDRFEEPVLELDDLPAEAAHDLVWSVAAALRAYLYDTGLPPVEADRLAVDAGRGRLAHYDEGEGLTAVATRLAQALAASDALDDGTLAVLLEGGELNALHAALAHRAGLRADATWGLLAEAEQGRLALLLRAAGVGRELAARVLLRFLGAADDPALELDRFDRCTEGEARDALAILGHDPVYAGALRRLGQGARR